jgi:hypothetical protein
MAVFDTGGKRLVLGILGNESGELCVNPHLLTLYNGSERIEAIANYRTKKKKEKEKEK